MDSDEEHNYEPLLAGSILVGVIVYIVSAAILFSRSTRIVIVPREIDLPVVDTVVTIDNKLGATTTGRYYSPLNGNNITGKEGNELSCDQGKWGPDCNTDTYSDGYYYAGGLTSDSVCMNTCPQNNLSSCIEQCDKNQNCVGVYNNNGRYGTVGNVSVASLDGRYNPLEGFKHLYLKNDKLPLSTDVYVCKKGVLRYWIARDDVVKLSSFGTYKINFTIGYIVNTSNRLVFLSNDAGDKYKLDNNNPIYIRGFNTVILG